MRKLFILIYLIIGNILWSQDILTQTVLNGNIDYLSDIIKIEQLINFSRSDLRILRNTVFAKYGLIFNSNDLQDHFSQFSWYNGIYSNVYDQLTDIDKENINFIQQIESNYPENNDFINELIGNWYFFGALGSGSIDSFSCLKNSNRVQILSNGIYIYYVRNDVRMSGILYGMWSLKDNVFETIPIGSHLVHFRSLANNVDEFVTLNSPTYGKVTNFRTYMLDFYDGNIHFTASLFDHGMWAKE
jgi:hypothetical protein